MSQHDKATMANPASTSLKSSAFVKSTWAAHEEGSQQGTSIHLEATNQQTQSDSDSEDDRQSDSGRRMVDDSLYSLLPRKRRRVQEQENQHHQATGQMKELPLRNIPALDKSKPDITTCQPQIVHNPAPTMRKPQVPPPSVPMFHSQRVFWEEWCKRKRYPDGDLVTGKKFVAFVKELLALEVHHDRENPHLSVLPLRLNASDYYDGDLPTCEKVSSYIDVVRLLSLEQCSTSRVSPDLQGAMRSMELELLLRAFQKHAAKSSFNLHNHNLRAEDTQMVLRKSIKLFRASDYRVQNKIGRMLWYSTLRTRLHFSFDYFKIDISHSITDVELRHIFSVISSEDRGSALLGVAFAKPVIKTQGGLPVDFMIFERHPDAAVCPVGSLAFFMMSHFSSVKNGREYQAEVLSPHFLLNARVNDIPLDKQYLQQNRRTMLKMLYHGGSCDFRRGQNAKSLQALRYQQKEFGEVVVDPGPDNKTRICLQQLKPGYLNFNPTATITTASTETTACGPYKLIGTVVDNGEQEHRRVYRTAVNPPCSLQREIFPFLNDMFMSSDWSQWHSNIMTGRPEEEGRPWQTRSVYPDSMMPAIRMAILLVYLRRVILQDLAVFMAFEGCSGGIDWQHCLFADNPVFASEPFLHFAAEVRAAVTLAETSAASAMERHPSSTNAPSSSTEVRPSPSPSTGPSQNDLQQQQQQQHLPCDSTSATPSLPLPPTVSTNDEPSICDGGSQGPQQDSLQGPLPEPSPQLLPASLQEPSPQHFPEPFQESAQEVFLLSHHDQICDAPCQDSVAPSSLLADIVRVEKAAARRQAIEGIKMAMVYLDHQARSQTKAVVEFSATAVMSIETLQTRMKTLQDSLQRLQFKMAESKASILV